MRPKKRTSPDLSSPNIFGGEFISSEKYEKTSKEIK